MQDNPYIILYLFRGRKFMYEVDTSYNIYDYRYA